MMLRVYNTLSGKKEVFKPLCDKKVGMYVCGVTVYDLCHIGHARSTVVFDVIFRYLRFLGYEVTYVRNITDVDDKIIKKANAEDVECEEIANRYIREFTTDMEALGLEKPTHEPKATDHIREMIRMAERLMERGYAYQTDGDVFFSVEKFAGYGKLSKRSPEQMRAGARVEIDEKKRNPLDFALWKASKPGEPSWDSPWGRGRPGWHIECSAMSQAYLGNTLDIHGGGKDLIFPHHENEITQSEGATGKPLSQYWVHNGFVNINREKMSKSLGNILTIKEILDRYHPEIIRFFLLSHHYRSPVDFSDRNLAEAKMSMDRFYSTLKRMDELEVEGLASQGGESSLEEGVQKAFEGVKAFPERFKEAMDNDFNTALALGHFHDLARNLNAVMRDEGSRHDLPTNLVTSARDNFRLYGNILGLFQCHPRDYLEGQRRRELSGLQIAEDQINRMIRERDEARKQRDWKLADEIRESLSSMGIALEDEPDGTTWKRK
ncbi:MAG: cysteine--tRNA ligase [Syntrophobacterales bacterium]|nr:MAG: cysteine--tRNA ligase [Syntrophobacterales bacterium]